MSATVEVAANVEVSHVRSHKEPLAQASRCGLGYRVESWLVDRSVDSCRGKSLIGVGIPFSGWGYYAPASYYPYGYYGYPAYGYPGGFFIGRTFGPHHHYYHHHWR